MSDATKLCPTCNREFVIPKRVTKGKTASYCRAKCRPSRFQRTKPGPVDQTPPQCALETNVATCERIYTDDELELMMALEAFKKRKGVKFPTPCQILAIAVGLGYRKRAVGSDVVT